MAKRGRPKIVPKTDEEMLQVLFGFYKVWKKCYPKKDFMYMLYELYCNEYDYFSDIAYAKDSFLLGRLNNKEPE